MMSRVVREAVEAVALALVVFLFLQISVSNFKVDGSSMQPTVEHGQYLLINKLVYFQVDTGRLARVIPFWSEEEPEGHFAIHPPNRGEVIVFRFPRDPEKDFVKRVLGLPGEEVQVRNGMVYIDGVLLEEPYLAERDRSNDGPTLLKEREYYVIGDNRRNSRDSRTWGPVPEENIRGKVWLVYWPFSQVQLLNPTPSFLRHLFE